MVNSFELKHYFYNALDLQGDPNQNFLFQMAIPLKLSLSDP